MTPEQGTKKDIPTAHMGLYAVYRVKAMEQVAKEMGLQFSPLKQTGEKYGPNEVPANMVYVSLDPGDKSDEYWQKVNEIAAPPTAQQIASGEYLR